MDQAVQLHQFKNRYNYGLHVQAGYFILFVHLKLNLFSINWMFSQNV